MEPIVGILVIIGIIYGIGYHFGEKEAHSRLEKTRKSLENEFRTKQLLLQRKFDIVKEATTCKSLFSYVADLYADLKSVVFTETEYSLRHKSRPAFRAAEEVAMMKKKYKESVASERITNYKLNLLLTAYPELATFIEDEDSIQELVIYDSVSSLQDDYDRVRDYINKEEWLALSTTHRNQLALDRWKKSPKSNWTIGMLYEMHIAHILRKSGYYVIDFGIRRGLNDLGRDIIAQKVTQGKLNIYVIQCKNWSHVKEIHENVICQLYGTTLEYKLSHPTHLDRGVYPLLITSTELSDMAKKFAEKLEVKVKIVQFNMDEFPLIKCNINNGQKIYHLPFDQQYWHTYIDKQGEFYAYTVKEAEDAGFRRAYRWHGKD